MRGAMDDQNKPIQPAKGEKAGDEVDLGPSTAIGKRLKAYFEDVASEPVPDRFLSLLDALDAAEKNSAKSGTGD